ncbi:hypothetical protein BKA66DRAFT_563574 [Pyrenochaeta sp. MPI-SDFR-AT-0127]|nr:hypothetical protein BKA66DRAFT_563574 [Pyrenochaeta sp. MPI-SDFR-AT-0127]
MAPYALTPTTERGEILDGDYPVPLSSDTGHNGASTPSALNLNGFADSGTLNQANGTNGHSNSHTASHGSPLVFENSTGTSSSTITYEDAYTFGYKEGYTSGYKTSHIELKHQPIAIIGMSCRLPGSVSTPDEFWELLARSRTGFSSIPSSRFSANRFFHPNPGKSGATNARGGNFLTHDLKVFDAPFFGFTQQEAISLDPQQRLLLECTFEALESAGIPKHDVVGKDVGVFVGGTFSEYEADSFRDSETIPMYQATAGVHLNMLPEFWISYSMSRLFGEEGRSFAFDQRGTGYGRGEGCAMILLKPLEQAIKDNDPIRAVITGSGINQDGRTPGIAGVIKTALMLERGFVVPNYDFKQPNEAIPFDDWGLKVPIRQQPWPFGKRWASVNGFGFGGTNAHVVMTKGPLERKIMKEEIDKQTMERLFILSANDKACAEKSMQNLGVYLEQRPEAFQNDLLSNLAYTLGQRKSLHPWRIAITASSAVDLVEALSSGRTIPAKQEMHELRIGWVFTGQGAQWWAMGRELCQQYPVYASALEKADAHLHSIGATFSLLEELKKEERTTQINLAHISQPSCTAVQLALVDLLRSWGIRPSAVAGHSSGEIGAAYAADFITFDDAMTISYHRGRLIPILKRRYPSLNGCMMAVGAGETDIAPLFEVIPPSLGEVRIACINSPTSVTVSGDADAIYKLQSLIEEAHPVRFHSSLLGRLVSSVELDASYWVQNLTCAVRFDEAIQSMCQPVGHFKTGVNFITELGPHAALQGPIKQILKSVGGPASYISYSSVLFRKRDAVQTALALGGTMFVKGYHLSMGSINFPKPTDRLPQVLVDMPRYAWNHSSSFYHESRLTRNHKFHNAPRNDIIGILSPYSSDFEPTWRNMIRLDDIPWLRQHQMQGVVIFPISGFVVMGLEAMNQIAQMRDMQYDSLEVENLSVKAPAMLTEEELEMTITVRLSSEPPQQGVFHEFNIRSWSKSKGWTEHCKGLVCAASTNSNEVDSERMSQAKERKLRSRISRVTQAATEVVATRDLYEKLATIGVSYGPTFQGLQNCQASNCASIAQITMADTMSEMPHHQETRYLLHPTILEQLISMYWPMLDAMEPLSTVHLPSSISKVTVSSKIFGYLQNTLLITPILEKDAGLDPETARELCFKLEWEPMLVSHHLEPESAERPQYDAKIVIIHEESDSQRTLACALSDRLFCLTGIQPITGTILSVAPLSQGKLGIFLTELERPVLANLDTLEFEALQCLLTSVQGLLWVVHGAYARSKNPDANMIVGLSRTLRSEGTLMKFITLDLDASRVLSQSDTLETILDVFSICLASKSNIEETEFREQDGKLYTPRIVNDDKMNEYIDKQIHPPATESACFSDTERPLRGAVTTPGTFNSLTFEDDLRPQDPPFTDHVDLQVKTIGLNYRDTSTALAIGIECSGILTSVGPTVPNFNVGDRVAAIIPAGCLSTVARAQSPFLFKLPDHISFESAATIPIVYCTVTYALIERAKLSEGEIVLIHDAASAVGQAALSIAQMIGARVFATVKTREENDLIMREFGVLRQHIWYAGSDTFAEGIRDMTNEHGVDVIFNTLAEPHVLCATWSCLANFGRFVQVGTESGPYSDVPFEKNMTLLSADIAAIATYRPQVLQRILADVARLLQYGRIKPAYQIKTFGISEVAAALQHVQASGIHGKAVVVPRDNELVEAPRIVQSNELFRHDATYLLIGGTGGLGRSMAKWMIRKGAQNIVLLSRSGTLRGKAKSQIDAANNAGANVVVRRCDVVNRLDVDQLISKGLSDLPPVMPVLPALIHTNPTIQDVLFENMTYAQYTSVISSKTQGTWNIYHALASAKVSVDFFVVISSAAGAVGNRGQAAYAAANTFLNGFAQYLLDRGTMAASIDLTAVSDAGYLAEDAEKAAEVARNLGSDTICEAEVLALIQAAIEGNLGSCNGHPITGMRITPTMRPFWSNDAKFSQLLRAAEAASTTSPGQQKLSWSVAFKTAPSRSEAEQVVCDALVEKIAEVISMEPEELDTSRALSHYPLDSLTAIEVRNFITRMFESSLQVLELLASGSIELLAKVICVKSKVSLPDV